MIPSTSLLVRVDHAAPPANDLDTGYAQLVSRFGLHPRSTDAMPAEFVRACQSSVDLLSASAFVTCSFEIDVHLAATLAAAPACAHLLHACGFRGLTPTAQLVAYERVPVPFEAISIFWHDPIRKALHRLRVAAAGYMVEAVAGGRVTLRFELAGADKVVTVADVPAIDTTGWLGARASC